MNSKLLFYLIFISIVIYCLWKYNQEKKEKFNNGLKPGSPVIKSVNQLDSSTLELEWSKPDAPESDPITQYQIMIATSLNPMDGVFMRFMNQPDCFDCKYTLNDLTLHPETDYIVAVSASNYAGTGSPSQYYSFKTLPLPTQAPTEEPTPSPTPFLDEVLAEETKKTYLDQELEKLMLRADGIYHVNDNTLTYPDVNQHMDEIKQSAQTMNDYLKKDLQENRLNIHLQVNQK